jgi:hypothetical protein
VVNFLNVTSGKEIDCQNSLVIISNSQVAFMTVKVDLFGREGGLILPETWPCWSVILTMTQSSAYLTKFSPLDSSSLSSSFSMMLLSIGERFPPCGVPLLVSSYLP